MHTVSKEEERKEQLPLLATQDAPKLPVSLTALPPKAK